MQETPNGISVGGQVIPKNAQGVVWVGADGNTYVKAAGVKGVVNAGSPALFNQEAKYYGYSGLKQIADPNPPANSGANTGYTGGYGSANTGGGGGGGGGTTSNYQDKSQDIGMQTAGLGSVDATQQSGIDNINKALSTIMGEYDADANNAKTSYTNESNANQGDLQSNKQTALEDAVQGRRGLFSTLASLGALSGTGLDLANRAVQKGANQDLTTAADTFATNQNALDSGYGSFQTQDKTRRTQAQSAAANDIEQVKNDAARTRQQYLTAIANDYQDEGNTAAAKNYAAQAASLFPTIASTNVPTIDIGYSGSAYTAPTLQHYVGQANNTTVQNSPSAAPSNSLFNIPGLLAFNKKTNGVTA